MNQMAVKPSTVVVIVVFLFHSSTTLLDVSSNSERASQHVCEVSANRNNHNS